MTRIKIGSDMNYANGMIEVATSAPKTLVLLPYGPLPNDHQGVHTYSRPFRENTLYNVEIPTRTPNNIPYSNIENTPTTPGISCARFRTQLGIYIPTTLEAYIHSKKYSYCAKITKIKTENTYFNGPLHLRYTALRGPQASSAVMASQSTGCVPT